jgi:uncharacterized membrane protein
METRRPIDLYLLLAGTLLCLALVLTRAPFGLGVAAGLALALVAPGFAVLAMMFPDAHDPLAPPKVPPARSLGAPERATFTVVLSLSVLALAGLALSLSAGVTRTRLAVVLAAVAVGFGLVALLLRSVDVLPSHRQVFRLRSPDLHQPVRTALLALLVMLSAGGLVLAALQAFPLADPDPGYTSFFFSPIGDRHCHPLRFLAGDLLYQPVSPCPSGPVNLTVQVVNHEGKPMEYRIVTLWAHGSLGSDSDVPDVPDTDVVVLPDAGPAVNGTSIPERQYGIDVDVPPPPGSGLQYLTVILYKAPEGQAMTKADHLSIQLRVIVP